MSTKASIGIVLAFVVVYALVHVLRTPRNLIFDQDWVRTPGVEVTKRGLTIFPLDRVIAHQDGSAAQPNPPVVLMGPHLLVSGDFNVTAKIENKGSVASLRLYGQPPIVYDQWRFESPSVQITTATSSISLRVWDGSSSSSIDMREFQFAVGNQTELSISHVGKMFNLSVNRVFLGAIPDHAIFIGGEVWFGFEASGAPWDLTNLTAQSLHGGKVTVLRPPNLLVRHDADNSLRGLASRRNMPIHIGAAVSYGALVTDEMYRGLVFGQFNSLTPENGLKPQFVHPQKNIYVFNEMDVFVNTALSNDAIVHGHTLVYAKSTPRWMIETPKASLQAVMVEHIETVVGHFKGRIAQWDVVNEPLSSKKEPYKNGGTGLEQTLWFNAMGEKYIDLAFKTAHTADPSAKLYLNEYGLEREGERWDAFFLLITRLKKRGVPIDGVGFESHIYGDGDYTDAHVLKRHFKALADLGLLVRISEIDVTGDDEKEQINQYVLALDVCLRSPNCTGYTTWGVTDAYGSTTRSDRYPLVYGTSLLWDSKMKAKPAYEALEHRLKL